MRQVVVCDCCEKEFQADTELIEIGLCESCHAEYPIYIDSDFENKI